MVKVSSDEIESKIRSRLTALGYTRNVEVSVEFSQMSAGARADATLKVEGKRLGSEEYAQESGALSEEAVRKNALLLLWDYFQGRSEASIHLALQDRYWVVDEARPEQLQDTLNRRTSQGYVLYKAFEPLERTQTLVFHVRHIEDCVLSNKV